MTKLEILNFKNENDIKVFDNLIAHALGGIIANDYEGYSDNEMATLAVSYAIKTMNIRNKIVYD